MIRSVFSCLIAITALTFAGCTSNEIEMGGVPSWLTSGAKLGDEPEPKRFDAAMLDFREESGPVEFFMVTDRRNYPLAPPKKAKKEVASDPLERGRDYRIKRLFH